MEYEFITKIKDGKIDLSKHQKFGKETEEREKKRYKDLGKEIDCHLSRAYDDGNVVWVTIKFCGEKLPESVDLEY